MQKHHVHTTISSKHHELLKRQVEKHGSQQKAIELALESIDNNSKPSPQLSPEEEYWMRIYRETRDACIVQKEVLKFLLSTIDLEGFKELTEKNKIMPYAIEFYGQKPLSEYGMKEFMDATVINGKISGWMDSVTYSDDGDHYTGIITHGMGINNSKWLKIMLDDLFNTYGIRTDMVMTERTLFIKIFKKS